MMFRNQPPKHCHQSHNIGFNLDIDCLAFKCDRFHTILAYFNNTTIVVSRFVSWNPLGNSPVCSVDGLPGMTEQSGKRLESVPAPLS